MKRKLESPCGSGDESISDDVISLRNCDGRPELFYFLSFTLVSKRKFFADWFSGPDFGKCIETICTDHNYDHHVNFMRLLYLPVDLQSDSVKPAIGVLELPIDNEELHPVLGGCSLGAQGRGTVRFATSTGGSCPPFGDELKISAQEQIEYMLGEDEDMPLVTADDEVKSVVRMGLSRIFSTFEKQLSSLVLESDLALETAEANILQCVSDLEWMCHILPKMELMKDFVSSWAGISGNVVGILAHNKLESVMWGLKVKLIVVSGKALEAVGYGNVILPAPIRVQLLKSWLLYIREMKPILDSKGTEDASFPHKMDEDLCQSIEGAIISVVLALPSNDQADILADWMEADQVRYPDLSEAFEVWCYRTKSAKRRLVEGSGRVDNTTVSLE
ncbi:hypothetical protein SADUNF_Sadunf03G0109800 [Salix dunnii]|uniref:At3g05675-like ankyrin-like domain-containing protein n=1 Tax=Salix dunnii TaxID=1413687 RepID=A0A835KCJ2_9ROSI|nr:hypothetical protein SADUNF_Sadunf03G0109800 [Salix dunnii]